MKDKDEKFLIEKLGLHASKWRDIGTALRFLPSELDSIGTVPKLTDEQRLGELLHKFVKWPTTAHPQAPTMEMLRDSLQSETVGEGPFAKDLFDARIGLPSQHDGAY